MTPAHESPDAARFEHDRLAGCMVIALIHTLEPLFLPDDLRDQARELFESGEQDRLSDKEAERRVLAVLRALIAPQSPAATAITRLTAERDAALRDAERYRHYREHINGPRWDRYFDDCGRHPLDMEWLDSAIDSEIARRAALSAQERGNV